MREMGAKMRNEIGIVERNAYLLPSELALQYKAFPFAGGQITTVTQTHYLGVVLSANGILECSLKNRIQMSHA